MPAEPRTLPVGRDWLDDLPLPAVIIREGRFVYANDAFLALLGLTREEAIGMRLEQRVVPEHRERVLERHRRRLRGEAVPTSYELDVLRGDGERRTVELFISQADEDTLLQVHDVTGRVRRSENLRALARLGATVQRELSEESVFRAVGEGLLQLGALVVRLRPDSRGVEVIGAPGVEWLSPPAPVEVVGVRGPWNADLRDAASTGYAFVDDLPLAAARFAGEERSAALRRALTERGLSHGAMIRVEVPGRNAELLVVIAGWLRPEDQPTLSLFGAQVGAALEAARVVRDLSQRNAELTALNHVATHAGTARELADLFEHACRELVEVAGCGAVGLYLVDEARQEAVLAHRHGSSDEAARPWVRLPVSGSRLGEVVTAKAARVLGPDDYDAPRRAAMESLGQRFVAMVPMLARSRVVGVVNATRATSFTAPQLDLLMAMAAHLGAAVETSHLVEDLRRSYDELSRAQQQLVHRERLAALGEMAAAVAHEVRNPLAVIFNSLSSLKRSTLGQDHQLLLAMLSEESERIDHLVNDLLELARPTLPALLGEVPLSPLLREAVGSVLTTVKVPVDFVLEHSGADAVAMDPRMMRQVFVNLTVNAVQAMPNGGQLRVRVAEVRKGEAVHVRVVFGDTGHGIPRAVLPRIFEPFFTTRARGTGLGLTLVRRILEGHRGEVSATSVPGATELAVQWPMHVEGLPATGQWPGRSEDSAG